MKLFKRLTQDRAVMLVVALFVVFSTVFAYFSITKHYNFESLGYDMGIFSQHIWKYSQFKAPENTIRMVPNLLSDHFHPILMLLGPLYGLFPSAKTILIVQAVLMSSAVFPVFLFSKNHIGSKLAVLAASLVGLFWGVHSAILYDFHEIAFAVPLLGWLVYFMDTKRFGWYWVALVLLFLTKEEFWIYAVFSGGILLYWRNYKHGLASIFGGLFGFTIVTKAIMPALSGGRQDFQYLNQYDTFGDSTSSIVWGVLTRPALFIVTLFRPAEKAATLGYMLVPFLMLPLVSPYFLLAVPSILQRMLSSNDNLWTTDYHYTATIAAVLIMAMVDTIGRVRQRYPNFKVSLSNKMSIGPELVVFAAVAINLVILAKDTELVNRIKGASWYSTEVIEVGHRALESIPDGVSVIADDALTPHLANRDQIYRIADLQWAEPIEVTRAYDYIVTTDAIPDFFVEPDVADMIIDKITELYDYELLFEEETWRVYKLESID